MRRTRRNGKIFELPLCSNLHCLSAVISTASQQLSPLLLCRYPYCDPCIVFPLCQYPDSDPALFFSMLISSMRPCIFSSVQVSPQRSCIFFLNADFLTAALHFFPLCRYPFCGPCIFSLCADIPLRPCIFFLRADIPTVILSFSYLQMSQL